MRVKNTIVVAGKRKVCRIFFYPDSWDCYTIAFKAYREKYYGLVYPYLASSNNPFHAHGFGMHGESKEFLTGRHLGKRVSFDSLPVAVQKFILQSI